jgi:hypothetical protein
MSHRRDCDLAETRFSKSFLSPFPGMPSAGRRCDRNSTRSASGWHFARAGVPQRILILSWSIQQANFATGRSGHGRFRWQEPDCPRGQIRRGVAAGKAVVWTEHGEFFFTRCSTRARGAPAGLKHRRVEQSCANFFRMLRNVELAANAARCLEDHHGATARTCRALEQFESFGAVRVS